MRTPRKRLVFATPRRRLKPSDLSAIRQDKSKAEVEAPKIKTLSKRTNSAKSRIQQDLKIAEVEDARNPELNSRLEEQNDVIGKNLKKVQGKSNKIKSEPLIQTSSDGRYSQQSRYSEKTSALSTKSLRSHQKSYTNQNSLSELQSDQSSLSADKSKNNPQKSRVSNQKIQKTRSAPKNQKSEIEASNNMTRSNKVITYSQNDFIREISTESRDSSLSIAGTHEMHELKSFSRRLKNSTDEYLEHVAISREKEKQMIKQLFASNEVLQLIQKFLGLEIVKNKTKYEFSWNVTDGGTERSIRFSLIEGDNDFTYCLESYENIVVPDTFTCMFTFDEDMLTRFMFNVFEMLLAKTE